MHWAWLKGVVGVKYLLCHVETIMWVDGMHDTGGGSEKGAFQTVVMEVFTSSRAFLYTDLLVVMCLLNCLSECVVY